MQGFNVSEAGHVVPLICPVSSSSTVVGTSQWFSMKGWAHCSIIILLGANGSATPTGVTINVASSAAGAGSTAMGFRYYKQVTTPSGDVLSTPGVIATTSGFVPSSTVAGCLYTIEIDSAELESLTDGLAYLQLVLAGGNTTLISAVAVLSAGRQAYGGSATTLT